MTHVYPCFPPSMDCLKGTVSPDTPPFIWVCLKMVYTPNEIAIFRRDNDQQNHWVQWGTQHFQ